MVHKTRNLLLLELDFRDVTMKKVKFKINGWSYNIQTEETFATYLLTAMKQDFTDVSVDGRKTILLAYIKAKHELHEQDKAIQKIIEEIS